MAQFIDEKNQTLLWNAYQRISETSRFSMDNQRSIFQSILSQQYYTLNPQHKFTKMDLQAFNKETVRLLLQELRKSMIVGSNPSQQQQQQPQPQQETQSYSTVEQSQPMYYETPEERMQRIYEEKQKQYTIEKPKLPKPSELFQEPTSEDDGVLQNVDQLIQEYQQQRQQEVPEYSPIIQESTSSTVDISYNNNLLIDIRNTLMNLEERLSKVETMLKNIEF
tara:strand:- start:281 stop:946 length:666 start_codon:yes stop_codon:yes gene_type:complete